MSLAESVVVVVVPARDEAAWIAEVITTMPPWVDRVVVVDDASRDGTAAIAARVGDPRVEVIRHRSARGVGGAIAAGYRRALGRGGDVVAVMAGDGQMDPADLERVVRPIVEGRADYVKGNRLRHPDAPAMPRLRRLGTTCLGVLTGWAIGVPLGDSQCGFTAISSAGLRRLELERLWTGYGYPNDLLGAVARARLDIVEVAVRPVYRGEASGLRARHAAVILALIARAAVRRWRQGLTRIGAGGLEVAPVSGEGSAPSPRGAAPSPTRRETPSARPSEHPLGERPSWPRASA